MVWIFRSGGQTTCIAKIMHKHTHEDSKNKGGGGSIHVLVLLTTICPTRPYAEILWGEGGIFLIIMWNTANKFLELKLRDLVHIWGIFH